MLSDYGPLPAPRAPLPRLLALSFVLLVGALSVLAVALSRFEDGRAEPLKSIDLGVFHGSSTGIRQPLPGEASLAELSADEAYARLADYLRREPPLKEPPVLVYLTAIYSGATEGPFAGVAWAFSLAELPGARCGRADSRCSEDTLDDTYILVLVDARSGKVALHAEGGGGR